MIQGTVSSVTIAGTSIVVNVVAQINGTTINQNNVMVGNTPVLQFSYTIGQTEDVTSFTGRVINDVTQRLNTVFISDSIQQRTQQALSTFSSSLVGQTITITAVVQGGYVLDDTGGITQIVGS